MTETHSSVEHPVQDASAEEIPLRKHTTEKVQRGKKQHEIRKLPTPERKQEEQKLTALQQHSAFFDRNRDGKITIGETYSGFRAIGFNIFTSIVFAFILNFGLAWPTNPWFPLPTSTIHLKHIHRANHGSDTGIYQEDGTMDDRKFDAVFDKWDSDHDGYWTWQDCMRRGRDQRKVFDPFGWLASFLEFGVTFWVAAEDNKLSKDTLRGIYDGSFFYKLEKKISDEKAAKKAAKQAKKDSKKHQKDTVKEKVAVKDDAPKPDTTKDVAANKPEEKSTSKGEDVGKDKETANKQKDAAKEAPIH